MSKTPKSVFETIATYGLSKKYLNPAALSLAFQGVKEAIDNVDVKDIEIDTSNFVTTDEINARDKSIINYNSSETNLWAGEAAPKANPAGVFGWFYQNLNGDKIQWNLWTQFRDADTTLQVSDLLSVSLLIRAAGNYFPFVQVYTKRKNDGQDGGSFYRSRFSYSTAEKPNTADGTVLLTSKADTPLYNNIKRVVLTEDQNSVGPQENDEVVQQITVQTGSNQPDGDFRFTLNTLVVNTKNGTMTAILNANDDKSNYYTKAEIDALLNP